MSTTAYPSYAVSTRTTRTIPAALRPCPDGGPQATGDSDETSDSCDSEAELSGTLQAMGLAVVPFATTGTEG